MVRITVRYWFRSCDGGIERFANDGKTARMRARFNAPFRSLLFVASVQKNQRSFNARFIDSERRRSCPRCLGRNVGVGR
jgi:hypothetical protein